MPRPLWKGAISFGLVTVPVSLYPATRRRAQLSFRLLHKTDHAPIDYRRLCSAEAIEVQWKDIEKGYEYEKGRFVVVTDEDFEKARVPGTQTIDIRDFVPGEQIDFAYLESPYWLEPSKSGRKAYALLRAALEKTGRVGIGTFVMRQREHLAALRPAGDAIVLTTMRFADEIRGPEDLEVPAGQPARKELDMAIQLVETLAGDFKPEQYQDTYREVLRGIIERKVQGEEIETPRAARRPKVVSLMKALEKSLQSSRRTRGAAAAVRRRGRRRPPQRKAA